MSSVATAAAITMLSVPVAWAAPKVVASVLPIHSLVAGVMEGVATPTLLLKGGASPHAYALKPADARALQEADAIFWVGPELEAFLVKPLRALPRSAKVVSVSTMAGIRLLDARAGGTWAALDHDSGHPDAAVSTHQGSHKDLHLWLDPRNAQVIARQAAAVLSAIDRAHAETYRRNRDHLVARLERLEASIRARLTDVTDRPYIVFHDAFQYFERRFATGAVGAVTVSPDRAPGARRMADLRAELRHNSVGCIFAEPQFRPAVIYAISRDTGVRIGTLDPLGAGMTPGADAYFQLMENLAGAMRDCLAASS